MKKELGKRIYNRLLRVKRQSVWGQDRRKLVMIGNESTP